MTRTAPAPRRVGRFALIDELGRGAQATVWRAHDDRLDREVALKLLDPGADTLAVNQWLHEARAVSRLAHPHIVPVFEADEHDGQPYLVFELVRGQTLAETLKRNGALPQRDAATLMLGVLDALRAAHDQGIVHRDLKPSNILLDADSRPRVMDFGIAARVSDGADGAIVGTPGYMSPEAAQGLPPAPQMDVFAAGVMLAEVLSGRPLLRERDSRRALQRVIQEDLELSPEVRVDDALRAVVQRALARDTALRWASAADMRQALEAWLQPQPEAGAAAGSGTLDFLLRRMRSKSDFPTLSGSVVRIQRVATSEHESLNSLAGEILKDVALTNKLLRMVNTVHYSSAGAGSISTVSRAVALVGFAGIRNMALSLVLLEHMKDKGHAGRLREEFVRSLLAGQIASELAAAGRGGEEAFLGAMFHNLGRLLTEYYFPDEATAIREELDSARPGAAPGAARAQAQAVSERVLGLSFERLGLGVAKSWGLPESLQRCMRQPDAQAPARGVERGPERLRWVAAAANDMADALFDCAPEQLAQQQAQIAERYGKTLAIAGKDLQAAATAAREKLAQLAPAMGLDLAAGSRVLRLLARSAAPPQANDGPDSLRPYELHATRTLTMAAAERVGPAGAGAPRDGSGGSPAASTPPPTVDQVAEVLAAGIQDITDTMAGESFKLNEVLRMILETMFRAMRFQRVVFSLRDPRTQALIGRFGLGADADRVAKAFRIDLRAGAGAPPDLFSAVCAKAADTLISDARAPHIAQRLPAWYLQHVGAPAFLLLPMAMKGAPFALIYGDKATPGELALGERELALLRTLRNQAVMAFRQAG